MSEMKVGMLIEVATRNLDSLTQTIEQLKKTGDSTDELEKELQELADALEALKKQGKGSGLEVLGADAEKLKAKLAEAQKEANELKKISDAKITLGIDNDERIKAQIEEVTEAYRTLKDSGELTGKDLVRAGELHRQKVGELEKQLQKAKPSLEDVTRGISKMVASAGGLTAVAKEAISFERAMAGVKKVVDGTPEEMEALADTVKELAYELGIVPEVVADIAAQGGQLGVAFADLPEFTRLAGQMSVAFGLTASDAAEAKARAQQLWPDNPQKQQLYVSRYGTHREVETEQAAQAHAAVMSDAVMRIWAGEGVSDLPPSLTAQMGGDDIIKLIKLENESRSAQQTKLKRESWGEYMAYSDPQKLQALTREQVIALAPVFGTERTQALVTKWESLQKAEKNAAQKPYKMEAGLKKAVIRSAFGDMLDPYNTKKEDREFLENVEYRLQERINAYAPALLAGETTEAELVQILINDLKGEFIQPEEEVDFWSWGGFWRLGIDRDAKKKDIKDISILPR